VRSWGNASRALRVAGGDLTEAELNEAAEL